MTRGYFNTAISNELPNNYGHYTPSPYEQQDHIY
jgi:hypothetical protein